MVFGLLARLARIRVTVAIEQGWLPGSLTRTTDVGMSYGAAAVLGSLTAAIPRRWRPGWWRVVATAAGLAGATLTECWVKARIRRKPVHQADTRPAALRNACEAQSGHRL